MSLELGLNEWREITGALRARARWLRFGKDPARPAARVAEKWAGELEELATRLERAIFGIEMS